MKIMTKRFLVAVCLLVVSATLLGSASFAWFSMNTNVNVDGIEVEAYSDSLFLEISKTIDRDYNTSVSLAGDKQYIRLAKHGFVTTAYTLTENAITDENTVYDGSTVYYKKVELKDSYYKYVVADDLVASEGVVGLYKNPVFVEITDSNATMQSGVAYYAKQNEYVNKYIPVSYEENKSANGLYTIAPVYTQIDDAEAKAEADTVYYTLENGAYIVVEDVEVGVTDVNGKYTAAEIAPEAADATLESGATYYELGTDGSFYVKNYFAPGTKVKGYYTLASLNPQEITDLTAVSTKAFVMTATNEYSLLGDFSITNENTTPTDITNMLYFGRAYSDTVIGDNVGNFDEALNIVKGADVANYRYTNSVYLRNANNTNPSKNLTAKFNVSGTNPLTGAVRVVLVVYDVTDTDAVAYVNKVEYVKDTRGNYTINYGTGNNIVDVLAGDEAQTLRVDIYVYYDGTDASAKNTTDGVLELTGNKVDIEFVIDEQPYNKVDNQTNN